MRLRDSGTRSALADPPRKGALRQSVPCVLFMAPWVVLSDSDESATTADQWVRRADEQRAWTGHVQAKHVLVARPVPGHELKVHAEAKEPLGFGFDGFPSSIRLRPQPSVAQREGPFRGAPACGNSAAFRPLLTVSDVRTGRSRKRAAGQSCRLCQAGFQWLTEIPLRLAEGPAAV